MCKDFQNFYLHISFLLQYSILFNKPNKLFKSLSLFELHFNSQTSKIRKKVFNFVLYQQNVEKHHIILISVDKIMIKKMFRLISK